MRSATLAILLLGLSTCSAAAQDAWTLTTDAIAEYQAGNVDRALALLGESLRRDSSLVDTYVLMGQIYIERDSLRLAESALRSALLRDRFDPRVYMLLGTATFRQGRYRESVRYFTQVLGLQKSPQASNGLSLAHLNLGVQAFRRGSTKDALRHFESAVQADSSNVQAHRNRAVILSKLNRPARAEQAALDGLRAHPGDRDLLAMLIRLRQQRKDFHGALDAAKALQRYHPDDVEAGLQLAYLYRFNNQGDRAVEVYERLLHGSPHDKRVYDDYADLFVTRAQYDRAIEIYRRLLDRAPGEESVHAELARIYAMEEEYADARASYRLALDGSGSDLEIFQQIADTYLNEERPANAADTYREGLVRFPGDRSLMVALGKVLEDLDEEQAVAVYRSMEKRDPSDPYPHVRLGVIFGRVDSTAARTEAQFRAAADLGSKDPYPYSALATIAMRRADTPAALELERRAITVALKAMGGLKARLLSQLGGKAGTITRSQLEEIGPTSDSLAVVEKILRESLGELIDVGDAAAIEHVLDELVDLFPDAAVLAEYRGRFFEREGWIDEAEETFEGLVRSEPENAYGQLALARIWRRKGEDDKALRAFKRALVLDDRNPEIYDELVDWYRREDRLTDLADDWLIRARRSPDNRVLLEYLAGVLEQIGRNDDLGLVRTLLDEVE